MSSFLTAPEVDGQPGFDTVTLDGGKVVRIGEKFRGRSGTDSARKIVFIVRDTESEQEAMAAVGLYSPFAYEGLSRDSFDIVSHQGLDIWHIGLNYKKTQGKFAGGVGIPEDENTYSFAFALADVTEHKSWIEKKEQLVKSYTLFDMIKKFDVKGAINVEFNEENIPTIVGVDVMAPASSFSVTMTTKDNFLATPAILTAFRHKVNSLAFRVNDKPFLSSQPGEVLFAGADGEIQAGESLQLSYKFLTQPNQEFPTGPIEGKGTPFEEVSQEAPVVKEGWDYISFLRHQKTDEVVKLMKPVLKGVYHYRFYEKADLMELFKPTPLKKKKT
jgi:hypothetical protein